VTDGQVTLSGDVSYAIAGLSYRYTLQPMRIVLGDQRGSSYGSISHVPELVVNFYDTLCAQYGASADALYDIPWRTTEPYDSPENLNSGDVVLSLDGGFAIDNPIVISGDKPLPCTVRCIVARTDVTGR